MRVAEVFKIGIGPSSSHTVGPMRAAAQFVAILGERQRATARITVDLFGSLALTGRGHGTDRAVMLGLAGFAPATVDQATISGLPDAVAAQHTLRLPSGVEIAFDPATDIVFHMGESLPHHPNGVRFTAFDGNGAVVHRAEYFSIGGGAVEGEGFENLRAAENVPYPFASGRERRRRTRRHRAHQRRRRHHSGRRALLPRLHSGCR